MRARYDRDRVAAAMERVRSLGPKVTVELRYAQHLTAGDAAGIEDALDHCDVFVPEGYGWRARGLASVRAVSNGDGRMLRFDVENPRTFGEAVLAALAGSGKPVAYVDYPSDRQDPALHATYEHDFTQSFDVALDGFVAHTEGLMSAWLAREEFMLESLAPTLEGVLEQNPALREKESLSVLMTLGANHTGLSHVTQTELPGSTRTFSHRPFVFPHEHELGRCIRAGREPSRALVARAVFTSLFDGVVPPAADGSFEANVKRLRPILDGASLAELEALWGRLQAATSDEARTSELKGFVAEKA